MTGVRVRREKIEIGVMLPQVRERPGTPEAERGKDESSPRGFRGSVALPTPGFWAFSLQNCERIKFCGFQPPRL